MSLFETRLKDGDKFDGAISRGRAAVLGTLGDEDEFASLEADFPTLKFVSPLSGNTENHLVHLVMMPVVGSSLPMVALLFPMYQMFPYTSGSILCGRALGGR